MNEYSEFENNVEAALDDPMEVLSDILLADTETRQARRRHIERRESGDGLQQQSSHDSRRRKSSVSSLKRHSSQTSLNRQISKQVRASLYTNCIWTRTNRKNPEQIQCLQVYVQGHDDEDNIILPIIFPQDYCCNDLLL